MYGPHVVQWVHDRLPGGDEEPGAMTWLDPQGIGITWTDGGIAAGAVYEGFTPYSVRMHVASEGKNWLTHKFLRRMFWYPFVECGLRRVTFFIAASHTKSLRFAQHFGAVVEGVMRDAAPDGDLVVLGMLRSDCRYIDEAW